MGSPSVTASAAAVLTAPQSVPSMGVELCSRMVDAAAKSCVTPAEGAHPNWDAIVTSYSALSAAIGWGAVSLTVIIFIAGFAWGKIVTATAEREARETAQACAELQVKKWLEEVAPPLIKREAADFLRTLGGESTISDDEVAAMAAAAGDEGKEDGNGKK